MSFYPEAYVITMPDPYTLVGRWDKPVGAPDGGFDTEAEAIAFLVNTFGADEQGRISAISHIQGEGYLVDLPDPGNPEGPWVFVWSFPRKRDAVRFVKKNFDGDSEGRIKVIDIMYGEKGPKDWSPIDEIR